LRIEDSEDNLKSETELYSNHWHNGFDIYFAKIGGYEMNVSNIIVNLAKGDKVYIYGHYNFTTSGCRGDIIRKIRTTRITIDVLAITQLQSSTAQAFFVYEAIERVVNSITGKQNAIYSDYFGREDIGYGINGPGSLFTILNGFLIRKFIQNNVPLRKLTTSLKELLSSLISIFAIGLTYEYIDGNQTVRIEDKNYFFQPNEILMIEDCSEYSEETADEFVYNEIEVGYSKFPEEGEYMLDEFNTKQEYSTPIKTNKNKLSLISDLIASGYAIEFTRRLQFEDEPVDSSNYDDDNFIIAARLVGDQWKSEKNESFTVTNGTIFSPETAYNLRITPKRNLFRWAQFINGGLFWCKNTDAIKNTFYKNNGDAETLLTGETKKIKEKADIILTDFDGRNHYFKPIWIHFKCRLSPDQVRQIKEAHTGLDEAHKNGYISTKDMDGNIVSGWLYELSYSPASEAATFKLLKADIVSSGVPMSCSDFADYTFWDFENKPIPDSIEDCIFANFD
jgi:hypothetical protein